MVKNHVPFLVTGNDISCHVCHDFAVGVQTLSWKSTRSQPLSA
jgi:hypothetical protein